MILSFDTRVLPESLPWLCLNGHNKEAERIARKAAAINGVTLSDDLFLTSVNEMTSLNDENSADDDVDFTAKDKYSGFNGTC